MRDKLTSLQRRTRTSSINRLLESTSKHEKLLQIIHSYLITHRIAPTYKELAVALGFSSPESIRTSIKALNDMNFIEVSESKKRSIKFVTAIEVPVYSPSAPGVVIETCNVDVRLFRCPPHYAIKLIRDVKGVGKAGSLIFIHKPFVARKMVYVVTWKKNGCRFKKARSHLKLEGIYDGVVVGSIFQVE
ncbi:LexA family protein [Vibrio alginolyticus]|uniref:LexA family protein n=1 Tax=Vibrio alginolyticus TaxID=663 RepID=UPI0015F7691D|nr:hypothetical protein [Vibrio alginolyticus]